jgi:hypothetical protein
MVKPENQRAWRNGIDGKVRWPVNHGNDDEIESWTWNRLGHSVAIFAGFYSSAGTTWDRVNMEQIGPGSNWTRKHWMIVGSLTRLLRQRKRGRVFTDEIRFTRSLTFDEKPLTSRRRFCDGVSGDVVKEAYLSVSNIVWAIVWCGSRVSHLTLTWKETLNSFSRVE